VSIKISTNEEISNIIITLQKKITDVDELKRAIVVEMTERGYDEATINEWVSYVDVE
jgi:predicted Ser/Thr protein kinase